DLAAAASAQEALLLQQATGTPAAPDAVAAGARVDTAAAQVAAGAPGDDVGTADHAVAAAVAAHSRAAAALAAALTASDRAGTAPAAAALAATGRSLHQAVTVASDEHRTSDDAAGRVADIETIFMM